VPCAAASKQEVNKEVLHPSCAGLDVHKDSVVAGVRLAANGTARTEVWTFDTTRPGLLALSEWLAGQGCTHVAMEATGVYWKPVWHILRWTPETGQVAKRESSLGAAVWPKVRHDQYAEETRA
jgi:hypothetical protein